MKEVYFCAPRTMRLSWNIVYFSVCKREEQNERVDGSTRYYGFEFQLVANFTRNEHVKRKKETDKEDTNKFIYIKNIKQK